MKFTDPRHPLRRKAVVVTLVGIIGAILIELGLSAIEVDRIVRLATQLVEVAVLFGWILPALQEDDVTPLVDPRDEDDRPLTPASFDNPPRL